MTHDNGAFFNAFDTQRLAGGAPAAGSEYSLALTYNRDVELVFCSFKLVCEPTVATRNVYVSLTESGYEHILGFSHVSMLATQTWYALFFQGATYGSSSVPRRVTVPLAQRVRIKPNPTIKIGVLNIQALDQLSNIRFRFNLTLANRMG